MKQKRNPSTRMRIATGFITFMGMVCLCCFFYTHDSGITQDISGSVSDQRNPGAQTGLNRSNSVTIDLNELTLPNKKQNSGVGNVTDISDTNRMVIKALFKNFETKENDISDDMMNLSVLFEESTINKHTLPVSQMLRIKFSDSISNLDTHFRQVEDFIRTRMDDEWKVDELVNFYIVYTENDISQTIDPHPLWQENPENTDEAIRLNHEKQHYKRDLFGQEVADKVWGSEKEVYDYKMKELEIIRNDTYTAQVKEHLIQDLKEELLENKELDPDPVMDHNAQLYIRLAIYADALMDMTTQERNDKIIEFRQEIFPPDTAKMIEAIDGIGSDNTDTIETDEL